MDTLFNRFHEQLANQGYVAKGGQMMDATFVEAPRQRNTREENKTIKAGQVPQAWETKPHKLAQKDVDARWTKKTMKTTTGIRTMLTLTKPISLFRFTM